MMAITGEGSASSRPICLHHLLSNTQTIRSKFKMMHDYRNTLPPIHSSPRGFFWLYDTLLIRAVAFSHFNRFLAHSDVIGSILALGNLSRKKKQKKVACKINVLRRLRRTLSFYVDGCSLAVGMWMQCVTFRNVYINKY